MSINKTLIFIGTIKKVANCGESMKNHLFVDRFREVFDKVITVDIFKPKSHPCCILKMVWVVLTGMPRNEVTIKVVAPANSAENPLMGVILARPPPMVLMTFLPPIKIPNDMMR